MTTGVESMIPATDETVQKLAAELAGGDDRHTLLIGVGCARALIARIDKERERAEEAEAQIESATMAMAETQPSWGWRISRVLGAFGSDFGGPEDIDRAIRADVAREIGYDKEAAESEAAALRQEVERLRGGETAPTHHHYKGGLYRVLHRGLNEADLQPVVVYQAQDGTVWTRFAIDFDEVMPNGTPRFAALTKEPTP